VNCIRAYVTLSIPVVYKINTKAVQIQAYTIVPRNRIRFSDISVPATGTAADVTS
jgi:hypothetical protein